jgi:hypothetical protein
MTRRTFLVSSYEETWLCESLDPIHIVAKFPGDRITKLLTDAMFSRPGAKYAYMETCEIDCDVSDGQVTAVRHLAVNRPSGTVQLIP